MHAPLSSIAWVGDPRSVHTLVVDSVFLASPWCGFALPGAGAAPDAGFTALHSEVDAKLAAVSGELAKRCGFGGRIPWLPSLPDPSLRAWPLTSRTADDAPPGSDALGTNLRW